VLRRGGKHEFELWGHEEVEAGGYIILMIRIFTMNESVTMVTITPVHSPAQKKN